MLLARIVTRHCPYRENRTKETSHLRNNSNVHRLLRLSPYGQEWWKQPTLGCIRHDMFDMRQLWLELVASVRCLQLSYTFANLLKSLGPRSRTCASQISSRWGRHVCLRKLDFYFHHCEGRTNWTPEHWVETLHRLHSFHSMATAYW